LPAQLDARTEAARESVRIYRGSLTRCNPTLDQMSYAYGGGPLARRPSIVADWPGGIASLLPLRLCPLEWRQCQRKVHWL